MSHRATKVPVVNNLRNDLSKLLSNLALIDGNIPLISSWSFIFSDNINDGGLDDYLFANSGAKKSSSGAYHVSGLQSVSQITAKPDSFDSPESVIKSVFRKRWSKVKKEELNLDGFKIGVRVIIQNDRIVKIRPSIDEGKSGNVSRFTKSCIWSLLDFNGEVRQKATQMVSLI